MTTYKTRKYYFITISPRHRAAKTSSLYDDDVYRMRRIRACSDQFSIWPEFIDDDRLHYHGVIRVNSLNRWYKRTKYDMQAIGYVKLKRIKSFKDHLKIILYCTKNYGDIKEIYPRVIPKKKRRLITISKRKTSILDYLPALVIQDLVADGDRAKSETVASPVLRSDAKHS